MAASATRDLSDLGWFERTCLASVELLQRGKRNMIEVEVEAHTDRVRRHEVIDLARLEHRDLRVPSARRERTEDDGCTAPNVTENLGNRVDARHGERHDRASFRDARERRRTCISERGEPRTRTDFDTGHELEKRLANRVGPEKPRLEPPSRMEEPVGEDVPTFAMSRELDLVDRDEVDLTIERHRFGGRNPILRPRRDALFLARHERHLALTDAHRHFVEYFAREQAQGQADHPALEVEHSLDGAERFPRVRGAEKCDDGSAHGVLPAAFRTRAMNQASRAGRRRSSPAAPRGRRSGAEGDRRRISRRTIHMASPSTWISSLRHKLDAIRRLRGEADGDDGLSFSPPLPLWRGAGSVRAGAWRVVAR